MADKVNDRIYPTWEESDDEAERQRAHTVPSLFKVDAHVEGSSSSAPGNLDHKQGGSFSESRSFRNAWGNESYATIITNAINSAPSKKMKLSNIYRYFESKFEYFGHNKDRKGWKNSVRHNLSLGKQFKRHQSADPKEKGSFWYVDDNAATGASSGTPRSSSFSSSGCRKKSAQIGGNGGRGASRARSETSLLANAVDKSYSATRTPITTSFLSHSPAPPMCPQVTSKDDVRMELTTNNNNFLWMQEPLNSWGCHRQRAQTTAATITCDPVFPPPQQLQSHFLNALQPLPPLSMEMSDSIMSPPPVVSQSSQTVPQPSNLQSLPFSTNAAWRTPVFENSHLNPPSEKVALGRPYPPSFSAPTSDPYIDFHHSNFVSPAPQINLLPPLSISSVVNDLNMPHSQHPDPGDFSAGLQNMRLDRSNLAPINAFCASSYDCSDIGQIHPTINELIYDNPMSITTSE